MSLEDNKALMRRYFDEFWCKGNEAVADEIVAADVIDHQRPPSWPAGRDGFKALVREWRRGFPDMHETIEDMIAEGDRVVGRFTLRGTHKGPFLGIPATGRRLKIGGIDIIRVRGGRVAELWYHEDTLGLYRQLGLEPPKDGIILVPGIIEA